MDFFKIITYTALYLLGEEKVKPEEYLKSDFEFIMSLKTYGCWFKDGENRPVDYYSVMVFNFYSLLYCYIYPDDKENGDIFKRQTKEFAEEYYLLFSNGNAEIPYGRSLIYRFAHLCFWPMYVILVEKDENKINLINNIIYSNLKWWIKQDEFDENQIPKLGFINENRYMLEDYNGFSSPLWCLKSSSILLLDKDAFDKNEFVAFPKFKVLKSFNGVITHNSNGSHAILYPNPNFKKSFVLNTYSKYCKFAYSNIFGFSNSKSSIGIQNSGLDSTLSFTYDNENYFTRCSSKLIELNDKYSISFWSPIPGIYVNSYIIYGDDFHIRIHNILSEYDCFAFDAGFCVSQENLKVDNKGRKIVLSSNNLFSTIVTLLGNGKCLSSNLSISSHIYFPKAVVPYTKYKIAKGYNLISTFVSGTNYPINHKIKVDLKRNSICFNINDKKFLIDIFKETILGCDAKYISELNQIKSSKSYRLGELLLIFREKSKEFITQNDFNNCFISLRSLKYYITRLCG